MSESQDQMLDEQITFEELRQLGCPDSLLMQYLGWTRRQIYQLILITSLDNLQQF